MTAPKKRSPYTDDRRRRTPRGHRDRHRQFTHVAGRRSKGAWSVLRPSRSHRPPAAMWMRSSRAVGSVEANRDVMVSSETAGRVTAVLVDVGDAVKKGQTLVQVDAELKEVAVQQARAALLAAKTNMEKAKKDFERTEKLYASGDVADVELEGYQLALPRRRSAVSVGRCRDPPRRAPACRHAYRSRRSPVRSRHAV